MSFDALAWAGKVRAGSAARKLVLLALADRHNTEENAARPSIAWLADWTDLNRKTVITALQGLESDGLISDTGQRTGATGQIKVYRLHLETVPKTEQSQKRNSSDFSAKQSQKRDTDTVKEPVGSEAKASSPPRAKVVKIDPFPKPDWADPQVWSDFMENRKRKKATNSATAYRGFLADIARHTNDEWPPGRLLEHAAAKGWAGIYDPRDRQHDRPASQPPGIGRTEAAIRAAAGLR